MENFGEWSIDDIESRYGYGECAAFSVALSKVFNLPIVEFYDKEELFHVAVVIEGKSLKEDLFLDVFGLTTEHQIKRRYQVGNKIRIEAKTEDELHKMSFFNQKDIEEASNALESLFQKGLFPDKEFIDELALMNKKQPSKKKKF